MMNGKGVLFTGIAIAAAGVTGWLVGTLRAEKENDKAWKELSEHINRRLKEVKERYPEEFNAVIEEKGDELDEKFKKELEEL